MVDKDGKKILNDSRVDIVADVNMGGSGLERGEAGKTNGAMGSKRDVVETFDSSSESEAQRWLDQFAFLEDEWSRAKLLAYVKP
jgi:hypothetical protein